MKKYLVGIDIGTSSCKTCIIDEAGNFIGSVAQEYRSVSLKQGWFEQNPEEWYRAVIDCLRKLKKDSGINFQDIAAVGTTGQMKGTTFMDSGGKVVRNTILWNDLRNLKEVNELKSQYHDILDQISVNPFNSTCTFPKAVWLMKHEPGNWENTRKIIFPKDFIAFRLTGNLQTDFSDASSICFYNTRKQDWWPEDIFKDLAFPKEKLPDFYPSTRIIGQVSASASEETGLPKGIPVVAGGSDATVESLSIGLHTPTQCKIRIGTAGALAAVVDNLESIEKGKYYIWSYLIPGTWMLDNNTRSCAQATAWYRDVFFAEQSTQSDTYAQIAKDAQTIPLGSEDLFFHPYLLGEDSPYWDPKLKGSFFGIRANHTRNHFARAVYEGTAYALNDARSGFGRRAEEFSEYIMVGGGLKNPVWTSIIVDVLGIDAHIPLHSEASFGACMLAGIGTGIFNGFEEAVKTCVKSSKYIKHNRENHKVYLDLFSKYKTMKKIYDQIYELDQDQ